jgi:hypothetical protein
MGERVVSGKTAIPFHPTGRAEPGIIHLADKDGDVMTITIPPMTALVQAREGYLEKDPPLPIPESLQAGLLFVPPPPPPPPASPGNDGGSAQPTGQASSSTSPPAALVNAISGAPSGGIPPPPPSAPAASVTSPTKNPDVNIPWVR